MRWRRLGRWPLGAAVLLIGGCAGQVGPLALTPVDFAHLPGWSADHVAAALPALLASCRRGPGQWRLLCADAGRVPSGDEAAMRGVLERDLQPWRVAAGTRTQALFTGYYEPEVAGSRVQGGVYQTPLYGRPRDLVDGVPYLDRAAIEGGALRGRGLEIAWLADPVDAYFLQIQGSGRVRLADGRVMRVGFAGKNGRPYVAIGKLLVARTNVAASDLSLPVISGWLKRHRADAPALMNANPSFVFFPEVPGLSLDEGPIGASGVRLTPGRSVAVDRDQVPLGAPVWVDTTDPLDGAPYRRLMLAQDTGTGIVGPLHEDIFYGWGREAEARAGRANQVGEIFILLPRP